MQSLLNKLGLASLLLCLATGAATPLAAAEVRAGLSSQETYVGLPVTLQIQVSNAQSPQPPVIPTVDGLEIKSVGTPARSTQISSINGHTTTRSTLTFAFEVTPQRTGSFRIPPITVSADGSSVETRAMSLVASKSETGDLLIVEIAGQEKQIYVGQALDVTLQIWIRPYRDREHNLTLSEGDMWQLMSDRSNWGLFTDRMQQLADNNQRPVGKEVLRKDQSGVEHSYYLYEVAATIYPKRSGNIDAADTRIVLNYPTAIGKARDPFAGFFKRMQLPGRPGAFGDDDDFSPFGSRLAIESVRPIVAETGGPAIDVLPIPIADRPADYRGAVGKYAIITRATPSNVKAGDPIELSIGIEGSGPMDLVQAPPLADLNELTADFKVPAEPLAGFVKDNRKLFTTTIRPRRAGVTQIPSIPFSFFDPAAGKFFTVHSDPITIHVDPADTLALDAIVGKAGRSSGSDGSSDNVAKTSAEAATTLFTGDDLLKTAQPKELSSGVLVVILAAPPLLVLCLLIVQGYRKWLPAFGSGARRVSRRIEAAQTAAEVATALRSHLSRSLRTGASADDATIVGAMRSAGLRQLAIRCERILDLCTNWSTGCRLTPRDLNELKQDALAIVDDLQSDREQKQRNPAPVRRTAVKAVASLLLIAVASTAGAGSAAAANDLPNESQSTLPAPTATDSKNPVSDTAAFPLTATQQKQLLTEATECYNQGLSQAPTDAASAKLNFSQAADKFRLLTQSGIVNSQLHTNLANAYLRSGQPDQATISFRRAIELDRTNRAAQQGLALAEQSTGAAHPASAATSENPPHADQANHNVANWLKSYVSPFQVQMIMLIGWFALWSIVAARVLGYRLLWKSAVAASAMTFAAAALLSFSA